MVEMKENPEAQGDELVNVYYGIDPSEAEAQGRSLETILATRRCPSCSRRIKGVSPIPSAKEQMKEIVKCCATLDKFITPGLPLHEIVFRLLLIKGGRPISLQELHYDLTEEWARPTNPMNVTIGALQRILDSDSHYGFKKIHKEPK